MTQVLVILGGFSENRFFGNFQILQMSDLGGLTLVPYGLPGTNGDAKLLIWPLPLIDVKTAMTQVLVFVIYVIAVFGYIVPLDRVSKQIRHLENLESAEKAIFRKSS